MIKKVIIQKALVLTILATFLSACVTGPEGYMKRSANNKLFDRKGFHGSKRPPVYNKKYIAQAKKNIINDDIDYDDEDDDDLSEYKDVSRENIEMYKAMIEDDLSMSRTKPGKKRRKSKYNGDSAYPSLVSANNIVDQEGSHSDILELHEEINQIKSMLQEATTDLASYKCPTAREIERRNANRSPEYSTSKVLDHKNLSDAPSQTITIDPVKSI